MDTSEFNWLFKLVVIVFFLFIIGTTDTEECKFECNCKKCRKKRGE